MERSLVRGHSGVDPQVAALVPHDVGRGLRGGHPAPVRHLRRFGESITAIRDILPTFSM